MDIDLTPFFKQYEAIAARVDAAFQRVADAHPDLVVCKTGCTDCCHALFDLPLIEALYLNRKFTEAFSGAQREELLEKANQADRKIYKLKKAAFKATQEGKAEQAVLDDMARERVRCPLLNENSCCDLYEYRPLACRIDGVPLAIGGAGRTCGLSGFAPGQSYPTVNLDAIHDQLMVLSSELVRTIESKYAKLSEVLVPVSMALLTTYDAAYLGVVEEEGGSEKNAAGEGEGGADE